ncbi:MAG: NAD-binding protein [Actinobacteria bacterium]|nr:NAD-binding protein [Actinomycetota bacterium]MCG2817588.1 NAD-binding protein [Actinomycetes bacterium]MBU4218745.1 NAD-binding protein [Actinomycetota bacterium]MBU4393204.1 NAD-binding protein [Actinomycetota bacterium]MBU4402266.1 NAD-binding protein [Actinomycetota bacterium]
MQIKGDPVYEADLRRANIEEARTVILLADESKCPPNHKYGSIPSSGFMFEPRLSGADLLSPRAA